MASLVSHRYGKEGVRLAKVERDGSLHSFYDLTVKLWLEGDFAPAYLDGDNSTSLPTDTMRATCYAVAADMTVAEPEPYLAAVLARLLSVVPVAASAHATATLHSWQRILVEGEPHPHAFGGVVGDGTCAVDLVRGSAPVMASGLTGLLVAKTTGSAYTGFLKDDLTVLAETDDRIMATSVDLSWTWLAAPSSYPEAREIARAVVETTFARHDSKAVQETLYATGEALLEAIPEMDQVSLTMPNRHHVPVDLRPLGRENANEVFVVLDRPFGVIEATVGRT